MNVCNLSKNYPHLSTDIEILSRNILFGQIAMWQFGNPSKRRYDIPYTFFLILDFVSADNVLQDIGAESLPK